MEDIDDDLVLEDEPMLNDYNLKISEVVNDCYEAIAWFDNSARFQIITALVCRLKIDEDKQILKCKK